VKLISFFIVLPTQRSEIVKTNGKIKIIFNHN